MNTLNQLSTLAVCYILLFLLCLWVWKMKSASPTSLKVQTGNWIFLHIRHAGGMIIMILIPVFFLQVLPENLFAWPKDATGIQVLVLMITGLIVLTLSANEVDKITDEKATINRWSSFHAVLHVILRNSFLVCYEWFFRGIVLFACVSAFGIIPALLINIVLYSLIHSFNGRKEFLGSIPFGIVLCVFVLWWQSVWPAVLLHMLLSSSYESVILRHFFYKRSKLIV